ncbi:MAG: response regulator transcription factor [Bacteroidetes bacterium]|nr:response regulator transcription factor [Bacteroidota bacterium]
MTQTKSEKITAVVVDDEKKGRENLIMLLEKHCPNVTVLGEAGNIVEARDAIESKKPQLVFLDIEMPGGTGFDLLDNLNKDDMPQVVFTTAYEEYAVQAIRVSALDYLLKPINYKELQEAVSRVQEEGSQKDSEQYQVLKENLDSKIDRICLPGNGGILFLRLNEIVLLEADRNYTNLHLKSGEQHLVSKTLKEFEGLLKDSRFFRPHRSFVVNLEHVEAFRREDGGYLVLTEGQHVSLAQNRKDAFFQRYNNFLK